jgi:hypothetical protein
MRQVFRIRCSKDRKSMERVRQRLTPYLILRQKAARDGGISVDLN